MSSVATNQMQDQTAMKENKEIVTKQCLYAWLDIQVILAFGKRVYFVNKALMESRYCCLADIGSLENGLSSYARSFY